MKQEKQQLKVLSEVHLNKDNIIEEIKKEFAYLEQNIKEIEKIGEQKDIYININETREKEKVLNKMFPYLRVGHGISMVNYYGNNGINKLFDEIEHNFKNRFKNALTQIGFISINEKKQSIKLNLSYGHIYLYYLDFVCKGFSFNLMMDVEVKNNITILKEYKNGTVEFKFNNVDDYNVFHTLVFWSNDKTNYIINNAPNDVIKKYKETKDTKHMNEYYIIHEWINKNKDFKAYDNINYDLINKSWGV